MGNIIEQRLFQNILAGKEKYELIPKESKSKYFEGIFF